ncbi:putative leucine-rich repeat domain, L domain-containing protein [Rosa chinensis]|uniref:Putative leucine-rich repeat domain, L domain-containing protein n=1 Tax=Rosa chinensis TaxID=74649 RepID=A0A2P6QN67_ROSCH|nr:putative leucine-rich repeat domain, L domain-containing protein [Rosa chinensis]
MLFHIGLERNLISGEFPKELCRLPALVSKQTPAQVDDIDRYILILNWLSTDTKAQHYYHTKLSYFPPAIHVGNNTINGNIPTEISQLQLLHTLSLRNNNFSGNIPEQMANLKTLEILDLSMNHLSGKIYLSLASLNFLSSFNVSYNNLEG